MKRLATFLALTAMLGGAAQASSPRCFLPQEIEAEQAMLFQTELMVVAETCDNPAYVSFLHRNLETVKYFQQQMIGHLKRHGEKRPEVALDAYLTKLANQSALRNGQMPVKVVCDQGTTLINTANALGPRDFRTYAAEKATINRQQYRACK
jgi:hypothetical protein